MIRVAKTTLLRFAPSGESKTAAMTGTAVIAMPAAKRRPSVLAPIE